MDRTAPKLKDIAERLNLSIGTVQRALHNKGGYSEETKKRILEEARRCNYVVNTAASALRRQPICISVILPSPEGENRYFVPYLWKGIENACIDMSIYTINVTKHYAEAGSSEAIDALRGILDGRDGVVQGVIANTSTNPEELSLLSEIAARKTPVFIVNTVSKTTVQDSFIVNNNKGAGKLCADIFISIHRNASGKLLMLSGSRDSSRQLEKINDFSKLMMAKCPDVYIQEIHSYTDLRRLRAIMEEYLSKFDDIIGIYAVSARETIAMCQTVRKLGLSGKITTIGTDVFPELLEYFRDDTLTASIYQYPAQQAYIGIQTIIRIVTGIGSGENIVSLPTAAVFASNAEAFCEENNASYRAI